VSVLDASDADLAHCIEVRARANAYGPGAGAVTTEASFDLESGN
jgi:hypothetical protein